MTVKEFKTLPIIDENEQVAVYEGDINTPRRLYEGRICNIPDKLYHRDIWNVGAMGEKHRERYHLNKYGWLMVWLEDEESGKTK